MATEVAASGGAGDLDPLSPGGSGAELGSTGAGEPGPEGGGDAAGGGGSPETWALIWTLMVAFILCNLDKVNMSVAVIPLAEKFGWTATERGLVSSSFFWGYALTQVPAGYIAARLGGVRVLAGAVFVWSAGTLVAPVAAAWGILSLSATRLVVGLGEGFGPSAVTALLARHVPAHMRARAVAIVFGGMELGNALGLLTCGPLIARAGWESVFYVFAVAGFFWVGAWVAKLAPPEGDSEGAGGKDVAKAPAVPYGEFLRTPAVWALTTAHFCHNWGYYTMLAWLPSYFQLLFNAGATQAGQTALLPNLAMAAMAPVVGSVADGLQNRGMPRTRVRKLAQGSAFALPALTMVFCALFTPQGLETSLGLEPASGAVIVAALCFAFAMSTWSKAGLYCNHQDLSPTFAAPLLGITNTAGALCGVVGIWLTGVLLDSTGNWSLALFLPIAGAQVLGLVAYSLWGSAEQVWD